MQIVGGSFRWIWVWMLLVAIATSGAVGIGRAAEITLKDGRVLQGKLGKTAGLAEAPTPDQPDGSGKQQLVYFLDDDLRRTFFSYYLVRRLVQQEENRQRQEKFAIRQRLQRAGLEVRTVGQPIRVQPFDEYGRRIFTMSTGKGPVNIVQGITELTPTWTKVEGISHKWDMRIATSSIPRDVLQKIILKQVELKSIEDYRSVARFYLQCELYGDARRTLDNLLKAYPNEPDLKAQLEPVLRAITQMSAQQLLRDLRLRHDAGQRELILDVLKRFPTEGVGGEILQGVREMLDEDATRTARRADVVKELQALAAKIPDLIAKENLKPIMVEIAAEIGPNTLDRMAAFLQNAGFAQTPDSEKLALAISGWLMGADGATPKLATAISAYKVRGFIRDYLTEATAPERERIFGYIKSEPGGDPEMVAQLLAHMKPPFKSPEPVADKPGLFELEVAGLSKESPVTYYVQLPPEYDPYKLYPTIVTLNAGGATAEQQIDWWAGALGSKGIRTGQGARYGYIVIAPVWLAEHQNMYGYSAREHAAVLNSLRDACRRFAIDTDRVFLTGHSIGGDAAWDIGLAHPDLWAGVIPIVAQSDRYCSLYWENARNVPFYVVAGELDGGKSAKNARDLDRYLRRGFDTTVVEYRGRGHEDFYDEILRIFDWMGRFHRNFFPRKFACQTMRSWDNFFWYVETKGLPPRSEVDPANWPPPSGTRPVQVSASLNDKNGLTVSAGTGQVTVWLSPKMLDFKQRATITVNGRRVNGGDGMIHADVHTILEDVRTRGDRQHPFWARLEGSTGRVRSE